MQWSNIITQWSGLSFVECKASRSRQEKMLILGMQHQSTRHKVKVNKKIATYSENTRIDHIFHELGITLESVVYYSMGLIALLK